ncbi:hypothetical protein CWE09_10880 [Aliidiomarina minuta]|uniref:Uncharacterized protein n=1 Tax=Aliidiomarina minuta TaxID=880057 RepID=A0A432W4I2_9GAMM|nr:hypothetical protein [Aliidiomarina minuta]RUO24369.1 hypothetical protein CWE09_10880 [Aliidiomarina minuta]
MMMHKLTRFPSGKFPQQLLTGDPIIDAYLKSLDLELAGSKKVRADTLQEVSEHLLDHKAKLEKQGQHEDSAAHQAVSSFGEVAMHGREQRRELSRSFFKKFFIMGSGFATLMFFIQGFSNEGLVSEWRVWAVMFAFNFLLFGALMSFWSTFMLAGDRSDSSWSSANKAETELKVYSGRSSKWAAIFLVIVMSALSGLFLAGLLGYGLMQNTWIGASLLLVIVGIRNALAALTAWTRYRLSPSSFYICSVWGKTEIPRSQITDIRRLPIWMSLVRISMGWQYLLCWCDDNGQKKQKVVAINDEMKHSNQLLAVLNDDVIVNKSNTPAES